MQPPTFTAAEASLTVTLHNRFLVSVEDQAWLQLLGAGPDSAEERTALVETRRKGQLPRRHFADVVPGVDVDRLLSTLVAKGLLVRVGRAGGDSVRTVPRTRGESWGVEHRGPTAASPDAAGRDGPQGQSLPGGGCRRAGGDGGAARALMGLLVAAGLVVAEGNTRARRYRLTDRAGAAPPNEDGPARP